MNDINSVALPAEAVKQLVVHALDVLKAEDIIVLDVSNHANFTDVMILASGHSTRHVNAIADSVIDATKIAGVAPISIEGESVGEWVLIDFGDIVVHVMLPATRAFYELEKLWGGPVVNQPKQQFNP